MSNYYYIVKGATKGENVGKIEAKNQDDALDQLENIYMAKEHGLALEIIDKSVYESEEKRIYAQRLKEATE